MTSRITITPNPAPAGTEIKICYDFAGPPVATSPVTLTLDWDPTQSPETIELTTDDNCEKVTSNANADGLIISDNSGQSNDESITFT